jgi:hypothetical protein
MEGFTLVIQVRVSQSRQVVDMGTRAQIVHTTLCLSFLIGTYTMTPAWELSM